MHSKDCGRGTLSVQEVVIHHLLTMNKTNYQQTGDDVISYPDLTLSLEM